MNSYMKYLRMNRLPHIWCAGCGNGIVMQAIVRALDSMKMDPDKVVAVSGIGCSSRAAGYMDLNTVHTAHGRAIPFATGIKLANPALTVIVITGDGDATAIGGNHFIHAARRNIDLSVILFNNGIYGMTGGQYSPLTPHASFSTTCSCGNMERQFDVCDLAKATGATYVARGTTYHARQLQKLVVDAVQHKGFSVIDALCGCPTYYGKMNNQASASAILEYQRDNAVRVEDAKSMTPEALKDKFLIGELYHADCEECSDLYTKQFDKIYDKQRKV
jgi:2-oxoglutarate ferredoxin oxidoreductase subunit beta